MNILDVSFGIAVVVAVFTLVLAGLISLERH